MKEKDMEMFMVVAWHRGKPYILQHRGVMDWYFYCNSPKLFKTLKSAVRNANKVNAKYKADSVKVYRVEENEEICATYIEGWEREGTGRTVYTVSAPGQDE